MKRFVPIIIVLLFTFLATFSLFHSGLFPSHDGEYHVIRFYEFYRSLSMGQWYPRWAPDLYFGRGVPLFTYVYPLPNYVAALFHFLGISFIDTFKINLILASFLGAFFMYLFAKEWWGKMGGAVSEIFYTFAPYHFVDIYIRGSVGEVWALALFPAFLWTMTRLYKVSSSRRRNLFRYLLLSAFFLALIIFSHNILALMFVPFAISYIVLLLVQSQNKYPMLFAMCTTLLLSLGLSSIFWLPALLETKYVVGLQIYDYTKNFPELFQLIFPSWGSGFFGGGLGSEMSVQIGLANLLAVVGSIFVLVKTFRSNNIVRNVLLFFLIWFVVICFLMLRSSLPLWQHIPLMQYFQFPWRFLSLIILICAFLSGSLVSLFLSSSRPLSRDPSSWIPAFAGTTILVILPILLSLSYAHPAYYMERSDNYYTTRPNFIDGTNSIGNVFNTIWAQGTKTVDNPSMTHLKTLYFPNWHLFVDGKETTIFPDQHGDIAYIASKGNHTIVLKFAQTAVEMIAIVVSTISLVIFLTYFLLLAYFRFTKID